ncbi:hypothetical protein L1887_62572 [Cichorium endivia]|nr:hypothetical protein L1887_62572 [Cichorium endivia]
MAVARVLPRRRCSVLTELNARNDPEEALEHLSALAVCLIGAAFRRMMATRLQSPMRDAFQWKVFSGRSSMEILSRQKSTLMIHRSAAALNVSSARSLKHPVKLGRVTSNASMLVQSEILIQDFDCVAFEMMMMHPNPLL